MLETEELGVVSEGGSEVKARRAMDATVEEHNSLCLTSSSDDGLQIFRAEVDTFKVNFFLAVLLAASENASPKNFDFIPVKFFTKKLTVSIWREQECSRLGS